MENDSINLVPTSTRRALVFLDTQPRRSFCSEQRAVVVVDLPQSQSTQPTDVAHPLHLIKGDNSQVAVATEPRATTPPPAL